MSDKKEYTNRKEERRKTKRNGDNNRGQNQNKNKRSKSNPHTNRNSEEWDGFEESQILHHAPNMGSITLL
eukprot:4317521-Ditylum_brightwellii.AAC.1